MGRHAKHYDDESPPSSTDTDTGSSSDSEDEKVPIKHHRRPRSRPAASANNRIWLALAIVVLAVAALVAASYYYKKSASGSLLGDGGASADSSTGSGVGSGSGSSSGAASGGGSSSGGSTGGSAPDEEGDTSSAATDGASAGSSGSPAAGGSGSTGSASKTGTSTAPASTSGSSSGDSNSGTGSHQLLGFWETWRGQTVAETDFSAYTIAVWFVAVPGTAAEKGKIDLNEGAPGQAKEWVTAAKKAGCKAMISIGGWSGSNTFSSLVATEQSRTDFISSIADMLDETGADGADLDWEYPGRAGNTQDFDVKNDLNNWLELIKALRTKLGKDKLISADTSAGPWVGADGNPSDDMSGFATVMDFITIMTYDAVTYASKTTGPNFAYEDTCAPAAQKFNIAKSVKSWTDAKFPANKIMLGIVSYGYAWKVAEVKDGGGADGATSSIYQTAASTLTDKDGSVTYDQITSKLSSMKRTFDKCSSTPFLYSSSDQLFITYDDEESIKIKGGYAGKNGLMGCSLYAGLTQNKDGSLAKVAKGVC